jgi:DNA end-binding protein Ku
MASTVWKGHLTFGLVSVPIKLFRAARAEKVHMHFLRRETGGRVKRVFVPADEDVPRGAGPNLTKEATDETPRLPSGKKTEAIDDLARRSDRTEPADSPSPAGSRGIPESDLLRGFEHEKGKYVEFEPRELEDLAPRSSSEMQILEFVHFGEVDPVYLENSYYVVPGAQGEKPYALLFEALQKTGQSAIAEFVMHRRDQIMLLRAGRRGIIGHSLFHEDEVRRDTEFQADSSLVVPREMELALKLINALAARFDPAKLKDKYRERLNAAIAARMADGARELTPTVQAAPVIDIMAALKASLKQARKPAGSEGRAGTAAAPGKKTRAGGSKG